MTDHASLLRQIRTEARPYIEQALELAEVFTGFRKLASENGLDWGVIKALIKAEVQDEKEGGSEKVDRIIEKADFAASYADMLGLGTSNMNEENFSSDRNKGRTWTNEVIDPITGEISDETAPPTPWSRESEREYLVSLDDGGIASTDPDLAPLPAHDGETGELIEDAPAPGAGGAGETTGEAARHISDASPNNSDPVTAPARSAVTAAAVEASSSLVEPPAVSFDDLEPPPFLKRGDPACAARSP